MHRSNHALYGYVPVHWPFLKWLLPDLPWVGQVFVIKSINPPPTLLNYPLRSSVIGIIVVIFKVSGPASFPSR